MEAWTDMKMRESVISWKSKDFECKSLGKSPLKILYPIVGTQGSREDFKSTFDMWKIAFKINDHQNRERLAVEQNSRQDNNLRGYANRLVYNCKSSFVENGI